MKALLIAVIVFAMQPMQKQDSKGVSQPERAQVSKQESPGEHHAQNSQHASPSPSNPTNVFIQQPDTSHGKSNEPISPQDLQIQRSIRFFTGLLVVVGFLQAGVMVLQWSIYRRQAREMRRQRHEMRHQRHVMFQQWKAMGKQAGIMEEQLVEMRSSASILQDSVAVAKDNAAAAKEGADAATKNVEMFISKERARLRIDLKDLDFSDKTYGLHTVRFTVAIHGSTAAYISDNRCVAYVLPESHIAEPDVMDMIFLPMTLLPNFISPNTPPIEQFALLNVSNDDPLIAEIKARRLFVGIRGFIRYKDVFDRERETVFRYVWKYHEVMYGLPSEYGDWVKCGRPEENRET